MELTYRGHRYQTSSPLLEECSTEFPCRYRGNAYQLKLKRATLAGAPKPVKLTYRGVSYTRML
jgi:hypothetical protein